jgi:hypothetical protein
MRTRRAVAEWILILEAFLLIRMLGLLIRALPFRQLVLLMGLRQTENLILNRRADRSHVAEVRRAVRVAARGTPSKSACLVRALTAKVMLRQCGVTSTLYLGVSTGGPQLRAHAWLKVGESVVTGEHEMHEYSAVVSFV